MFKALSDPTRLRALNLLLDGELCVCEVMKVLGITQSKASRHLVYLKNAGLVKSRRRGLWMHYSLTPPRSIMHRRLLSLVAQSRQEIAILRRDLKTLEKTSRNRVC
jgi:ArsR family transcriptional regulator